MLVWVDWLCHAFLITSTSELCNKSLHPFRETPQPHFLCLEQSLKGGSVWMGQGGSPEVQEQPWVPRAWLKCAAFSKSHFCFLGWRTPGWNCTRLPVLSHGNSRQVPSLSLGKASLNGTCESSVAVVFSKRIPLQRCSELKFLPPLEYFFSLIRSCDLTLFWFRVQRFWRAKTLHSQSRAAAIGPC